MSNSYAKTIFQNNRGTSIIIGENGSGKSTLLNTLAKEYLANGYIVIGIANSIHDKFTVKSSNFHLLGARTGRKISKKTIKNALINISNEDITKLKRMSEILFYVGYFGEIGIQLEGLQEYDPYILERLNTATPDEKFEIQSLLLKYFNSRSRDSETFDDTIWLGVDNFSFDRINKSTFSRIIKLEKTLKSIGLIKSINIKLKKNNITIPLNLASSGELSFITSMIYISSVINERTAILIDEPENSLHPKWQKEFLEKILDLFSYYEPKIIFATHSPLIVSGAEKTTNDLTIYKSTAGRLDVLKHSSDNLESILWDFFGVATPESRFVSEYFVSKLNDLAEKKINLNDIESDIREFDDSSYDQTQKDMLAGVLEIAKEIEMST